MKLSNVISAWWTSLFGKRRISIQNPNDKAQEWHMHLSFASLSVAGLSFVLVLSIIILTLVAYTPVLDLLPGYKTEATRSRDELIKNIIRLDSIERVMGDMRTYNDNIALIMEGKTPVVRSIMGTDSIPKDKILVMPSEEDSLLRLQIRSDESYKLKVPTASKTELRKAMELALPSQGTVTNHFDVKLGQFGVALTTAPSAQISSVDNGTVLMSTWTPENSYIIHIQHSDDRVSTYKNLSQSLVSVGTYIKRGEQIGHGPEESEDNTTTKLFEFELWKGGKPINPEQYIVF